MNVLSTIPTMDILPCVLTSLVVFMFSKNGVYKKESVSVTTLINDLAELFLSIATSFVFVGFGNLLKPEKIDTLIISILICAIFTCIVIIVEWYKPFCLADRLVFTLVYVIAALKFMINDWG